MRKRSILACAAFVLSAALPVAANAGFVKGEAVGTVAGPGVQPGTTTPCVADQACQVSVSGNLTLQISDAAGTNQIVKGTFVAVETADFSAPTSSNAFGNCYAVGGKLTFVESASKKETLVLSFQGNGCQPQPDSGAELLSNGTYVAGGSGELGRAIGVGTISFTEPESPGPNGGIGEVGQAGLFLDGGLNF